MKIVQINGGVFGSTGKIMFSIADLCDKENFDIMCASPITSTNKNREPRRAYYKIGSYNKRRANVLLDMVTGKQNGYAVCETKKLISEMKRFSPDIIHLHNIHGGFVNLKLLFKYIEQSGARVIWTLHDCWAFTGHCTHFDMIGCNKWLTECYACPQYKTYPINLFDNARATYQKKKTLFTSVKDMTIVTPSRWLASLAEQSFLKEYPIKVINNGIDLDIFKPTESDVKKKLGIEKKKMVLGIAFGWGYAKGLDVFVELSKRLPENYAVVLVGTDESTDKQLPPNIISIHRTQDQRELAQIYSAADVFVNPTRQENFPTVNMEALACGTPVVTFKTGGSHEIVDDSCGRVVEKEDIDRMEKEILLVCEENILSWESCVKRSLLYNEKELFAEYIKLYKSVYGVNL